MVIWLHVSGHIVREYNMTVAVCGGGCSLLGRQEAETQEGARHKISSKDLLPITYFLQLSPTS
jgi:hypothetical protein